MTDHRKTGAEAEAVACDYLRKQGLQLLHRNYLTRRGEIDIIAWDGPTLTFVEVRLRKPSTFGSGGDSVTLSKRKKITAAAEHFLQRNFQSRLPDCRFDVISIDGDLRRHTIQWIKNAFTG